MEKVFIDSDVILDILMDREPFSVPAATLVSFGVRGRIKIYTSASCLLNVHYVLCKQNGKKDARRILANFCKMISVLSVNESIIDNALNSDFDDFEDAVQYHVALENKIPVLITRNLKDYKKSTIPVMTAETYLKK